MLRITAKKIAQYEEYEETRNQRSDLENEYARDAAEEAYTEIYFIRETHLDPTSGQEVTQDLDDKYASSEEAAANALGYVEEAKAEGVISLEIFSLEDGFVQSVWNRDDEAQQMPQQMPQPMPMAQPMPMTQPFSR